MNETPETDNFDRNWDSYSEPWKAIEFARILERDRAEAREAIRALAEHGESKIQRITKERDEARAITKEAITGLYNLGDYDLANKLSSKLEETK
jgi:hypothetical protein